jgi:hypothetical protein
LSTYAKQLASPLDEQQHDDSDDAADEFHDAQPAPPEDSSDNASTCSADNTSSRSCPMPIAASGHTRKGSGGSENEDTAAEQQQQDAAAVAKAQQDLLADAAYVQSAAVTDKSQPKLGPQDFEILRVVGQGAFGKVRAWMLLLCRGQMLLSTLSSSMVSAAAADVM